MSISITKRRDAVLRLLRSDFDIEGTVKWVEREYADEPAMQRAKNKQGLARNIVTIGSTGDQQALNMVAFQQALVIRAEEQHRNATKAIEANNERLEAELSRANGKIDDLEGDYRDQVRQSNDLRDKLDTVRTQQMLSLERAPEPAIN